MLPPLSIYLALVASLTTGWLPSAGAASVLGDPGMINAAVHVMWEGWNFCNQAGNVSAFPGSISLPPSSFAPSPTSAWYTPGTSPRFADCLSPQGAPLVSPSDNLLSFPDPLPGSASPLARDVNWYAQEKARYLGSLCQQRSAAGQTWEWWTVMIKNGNLDLSAAQCPETTIVPSHSIPSSSPTRLPHRSHRPQAGSAAAAAPSKLMNQPLVYQRWTAPHPQDPSTLAGAMLGTFTMTDEAVSQLQRCIAAPTFPSPCTSLARNVSFFSSTYTRDTTSATASWVFTHQLVTDAGYVWLMLYHRADASQFFNGGYDSIAPGMMTLHELASDTHPHFHLRLFFNVSECTSAGAQFYLPEAGGCWKTDGVSPCDGDPHSDVTRYLNMIVNPGLLHRGSCTAKQPDHCPPTHRFLNGSVVLSNDTARFPYQCYYFYCGPPGSKVAGTVTCDAFSNPVPQELIQVLPCDEWTQWGFPRPGEGWVGDARHWDLDVGGLVNTHIHFFRNNSDAGPTVTRWVSLEVGPEVFEGGQVTQFAVSEWDVQVNRTAGDSRGGSRSVRLRGLR